MTKQAWDAEIDRVRQSGILGRSGLLSRLFDYLVEHASAKRPPKEIEIAVDVFGKSQDFTADQDAAVRVYVHRLRRKLDELYRSEVSPTGLRLTLPKGGYRITATSAEAAKPSTSHGKLGGSWRWAATGLAVLAVLNLAAWFWFGRTPAGPNATRAGAAPLWADLARDRFPTLIVVGDYFLVGDDGGGIEPERLIREFSINSKEDLYQYLMQHPEKAERYTDVGLTYLPISTVFALQRVMPLIAEDKPTRIITASDFKPEMLKTNDVIYLGHLSGLGPLRDTVFAASRLSFGDTYDEIIDQAGGRRYEGQAGLEAAAGAMYRDYGYLSAFRGPSGNHVVIIAGTRDASALGVTEAATQLASLRALAAALNDAQSFEALYEVQGNGRVNFETRRVFASPLDPARIWSGDQTARPRFPDSQSTTRSD